MTILKRKWILVTLTCLMLVSLFLMDATTQREVQASPEEPLFTLHMVIAYEATGYWDIASAMKAELAKIGINVELHYMDVGTYYDVVWGTGWNKTWDEGGWDLDYDAFWWMPTDLVWFEGCYSWAGRPPYGWNYMGWHNDKADSLLHSCLTTVNPALRKEYSWEWQKEFMHDPPQAILHYPLSYEVTVADLEGWNLVGWWYDVWSLKRSGTTLEDDVTLRYGSAEDLLILNPVFQTSIGSETFTSQTFDMLMKTVLDPETGAALVVPSLASDYPVYSEDGKTVTVYLRDDVTWHDGVKFNATDVKFTFDAVIDLATGSSGYGDFASVIDSVEIQDEYTVVFNLKSPCAYFNALLGDSYGGFIIPEHILRDVPHKDWKRHSTNTETPMPGTGPFKFVEWVRDQYWLVEANKDYFLGEPMVDRIYNMIITDPSAGLIALQNHEIDFGDCWSATMDEIDAMRDDPTLKVWEDPVPTQYHLAFNLHHPILSNRYVRQAIAHAIPYEHIITDLLPTLGIGGTRATAAVNPLHGYLYNTELKPWEYDLAKAEQYLNMWKYAQPQYAPEGSPEVALGPVGDADFSGVVRLHDFLLWWENYGLLPDEWPWYSGDGVDPDFNNDNAVTMTDFEQWRLNYGKPYPFEGAK